jgi:hypothetical protein
MLKIFHQLKHLFPPWAICAVFGLGTLLLNAWAHYHPAFVEYWYSRGLFQLLRYTIDWTTGRLPFPTFYLFWLGVVVFWGQMYRQRPRPSLFWPKAGYWLSRLLGFSGLLVGLFFWMWGFHYARIPLETQIGLDVQPVDSSALWRELRSETLVLDSLRKSLVGNDSNALHGKRFWPAQAEDTVRAAVEKWLSREGFPVGGRVRGRFIYPEGLLFKFGAAGIYWPFVGEGNVEAGYHPLRKLPAMAHEMSHGYGFSDEGVCNFIAYVACTESPNTYLDYCARLDYWNTLSNACWLSDPKRYENDYKRSIPAGILADEAAIHLQNSKFTELAPKLRYQVYDSYLKAQGIAAGMLSYEEVLMLVHAWRVKQDAQK